jgi:hypothetical protein
LFKNQHHLLTYKIFFFSVSFYQPSKKQGGVLFLQNFAVMQKYIELSLERQSKLTNNHMVYLTSFLSAQAKIIFKYAIMKILGQEIVLKDYHWSPTKIINNMNTYEASFHKFFENFKSISNPDRIDNFFKQVSRIASKINIFPKKGRIPWELSNPIAVAAIMEQIHHLDTNIPADLETPLHYVGGISLLQLEKSLKILKEQGKIPHAPKLKAISAAFMGRRKRNNLPIRFLNTCKTLGKNHPHRKLLLQLHQLERDLLFFNNESETYDAQIVGVDDLAMIEMDNLIFNKPTWTGKRRFAPCTDFSKGKRIVFSSHLFLTPHTRTNFLRKEKKLPLLARYNVQELPFCYRQHQNKLTSTRNQASGFIEMSDRTGFFSAVIKPYCKLSGTETKHAMFSKPSTGVQHAVDLYQLLNQPPDNLKHLIRPNEELVPFLILTRDNGGDQTVTRLENVLPYWQLMKALSLNGIKIICYCPGNSKDHPVEQGNRTLKRVLRGHVIKSNDGTEENFEQAMKQIQHLFRNTTHAGEKISIVCAEKKIPSFLTPYQVLRSFASARKALLPQGSLWYFHQITSWVASDGIMHQGCFYSFHSLELEVNQMQQHIVFFCIYACFIFRCKFDLCSFCSGTSWKWKTSSYDPHSFFTGKNCPSQHVCETLCKHQLLKDWNCLINQLSLITKRFQGTEKKKPCCSVCQDHGKSCADYTGHTKSMKVCPFHPKHTQSSTNYQINSNTSTTSKKIHKKPPTCSTCLQAGKPLTDCIGHASRHLKCPLHPKHQQKSSPHSGVDLQKWNMWLFDYKWMTSVQDSELLVDIADESVLSFDVFDDPEVISDDHDDIYFL